MNRSGAALLFALSLLAPVSIAECPQAPELRRALAEIPFDLSARTTRFSLQPPRDLYREAIEQPGRAVARRDGKATVGVILTDQPIAAVWQAVSDDQHFDQADIPVDHSHLLEHEPGVRRLLLQSFSRWGVKRWWLSDVTISRELFRRSDGRLWEQAWSDRTSDSQLRERHAAVAQLANRLEPMKRNEGAWLMVPFGERCTLVEYFSISDPGGFAGTMQWAGAKGAIRDSLRGLVAMARDHVADCPNTYLRPDGKPNRLRDDGALNR